MKFSNSIASLRQNSLRYLSVLLGTCMSFGSHAASVNLVVNGEFSQMGVGFTSYYNAAPFNTDEGQYAVTDATTAWNTNLLPVNDASSGADNLMLVANGAPQAGLPVWDSGWFDVAPQSTYLFEAWFNNVCCGPQYTGPNTAVLPQLSLFTVDGVEHLVAAPEIPLLSGVWQEVTGTWFSGDNTQVLLRIANLNSDRLGNDFALDNISFIGPAAVPEPAGLVLLALGLLGFAQAKRARAAVKAFPSTLV